MNEPMKFNQKTTPLKHLAIIMDGNGRWAKEKGLSRSKGHHAGTKTAKQIVEECLRWEISYLTLYTFSKENWGRPADEIAYLFSLLVDYIRKELPGLEKKGVKLNILGEMSDLPLTTRKALEIALAKTKHCNKLTLNLALNYSGRDEIARALRLCMEKNIKSSEINPEIIADLLYTSGQPDPDFIIRTSGEYRLSNFLLYQSAYSELYFTDVYWPDFSPEELIKALDNYAERERRFGGLKN